MAAGSLDQKIWMYLFPHRKHLYQQESARASLIYLYNQLLPVSRCFTQSDAHAAVTVWINSDLQSVSDFVLHAVILLFFFYLWRIQEKGWREAVLETGFQDKVST